MDITKQCQKISRKKLTVWSAFPGHQRDIEDTDYTRSGGRHVFGPYKIECAWVYTPHSPQQKSPQAAAVSADWVLSPPATVVSSRITTAIIASLPANTATVVSPSATTAIAWSYLLTTATVMSSLSTTATVVSYPATTATLVSPLGTTSTVVSSPAITAEYKLTLGYSWPLTVPGRRE